MSDDELLAAVLRRLMKTYCQFDAYSGDQKSILIDGVTDVSAAEAAAIERVLAAIDDTE